jgi:hypothetical protein
MSFPEVIGNPITNPTEIQFRVGVHVDDQTLQDAAKIADKQIYALTNRRDWSPDEDLFGLLQNLGSAYAAFYILSRWDPKQYGDKAAAAFKQYQSELTTYRQIPVPEGGGDPEIASVESDYGITVLNDEVPHFLSEY